MRPVPAACALCPRRCKADRTRERGFCGGGAQARVARAALHLWEEPCLSGTRGSGTVFFSGCTLRCCYCQNWRISAENFGRDVSVPHSGQLRALASSSTPQFTQYDMIPQSFLLESIFTGTPSFTSQRKKSRSRFASFMVPEKLMARVSPMLIAAQLVRPE